MRILFSIIFLSFAASAQVRPYQTARLKSTGGAGVASLLVTEGTVLNPAGLAYFNESFASYQKSSTTLNNKHEDRLTDNRKFAKINRSEGYFLFDNTGDKKGGLSYQQQRENGFSRDRIAAAIGMQIIDKVALGLIANYTQDTRPRWFSRDRHNTSIPMTVGMTWFPVDDMIIGAIFEDASKAMKNESRVVAGIQYSITQDFLVMADGGGDARGDFFDRNIWRAAAQYRLFDDFFVRIGQYQDKTINEKGMGYGISWTGPKLGIDFAMKTGRQIEPETGYVYPNEKLVDLSFAGNLRF